MSIFSALYSQDYCPMVFDSLLCWPRTKAGEKVWQKCPDGVRGLDGESKSLINIVTVMCQNDELSSTMSWVGCLLKDSDILSYLQK